MIEEILTQIPLRIVKMTMQDIPEIMPIEQASYGAPWPEQAYRIELANRRAHFELVRYQDKVVGYSGMWQLVDELHIGTLVSHPAARRQGIGELLLVNIIDKASRLATQSVTLEVRPSNRAARHLYAKYGFIEVGYRKGYYPDTGEDALIMTTPVIDSKAYQTFLTPLVESLVAGLVSFSLDESKLLT